MPQPTPVATFLEACLGSVARGYILFNCTAQQLLLPNIIALAGVLDAVPLESPPMTPSTLRLDARAALAGFSSLDATQWVYDRFVNQTTSMAKLNPGFDVHGPHKLNPPLTKPPHVKLTDYIVKERLFSFWLEDGCIPLTEEHALMTTMVAHNPWPQPIVVYGYDDTLALAGDLFEAETDCVAQHNLGQVASLVNNLAFWSTTPAITTPVRQVPEVTAPTTARPSPARYLPARRPPRVRRPLPAT